MTRTRFFEALHQLPLERQHRIALGVRALGEAMADAIALGAEPCRHALPFSELQYLGLEGRDLRWLVAIEIVCDVAIGKQSKARQRSRCVSTECTSCYYLNPKIASVALPWSAGFLEPGHVALTDPKVKVTTRPTWNGKDRELWWGNDLVKPFSVPAPSQELVLSSFEETGWESRIDDPLPLSKWTDRKDRLHEAIKGLNRGHRFQVIRFCGDGRGQGVRWEILGRRGD